METWATITLVLGSSAISALLTFFVTKMQVSHSDRRSEKQLEHAITMDHKQRKREIRSAPLKKLKDELADIALWGERLVTLSNTVNGNELYKYSYEKLEEYLKSGTFEHTLFSIDDKEIIAKGKEVLSSYIQAHSYFRNNVKEFETIKKSAAIISSTVRETQELINNRLEEL
jgi:hypothetical protein